MLSDVHMSRIKHLPTTPTVLTFLSFQNIFIGITELCTSHKRRTKPVVYTGQGECHVYLLLHICHVSVSIHSSRPGPWVSTPGFCSPLKVKTVSIRPPS
uniref:Uncharacterized protein n=1 Tax=Nomascus leucogenys TaxID=61853 RepID=A0A2I3H6T8_NOMLE